VTLQEYFASLVKSWWLIVALTLVGALGGYVYAQQQTEIYSSRSAVVVVPSRGDTTSELVQGANYVQNLVQTYAMVATSPLVLQPVIDELDLEATPYGLAGSITVENELGTSVLSITVRDPSAETAQAIADAVAIELADAVAQLSPVTEDSGAAVRIERITPARLSNYPVAPNVRSYMPEASVEAMLKLHKALGIERGVIVGTTVNGTDASMLIDALKQAGPGYRASCHHTVFEERSDSYLQDMDRAGIRGVRFNFLKMLGYMPTQKQLDLSFAKAKELGWYVKVQPDYHEPLESLAIFERLDIPVVVDHMGRATPDEGPDGPIISKMIELLKRGNFWLILSNAYKASKAGPPWDDMLPVMRRFIEAAPDRVVWATDWPHTFHETPPPNDGELLNFLYRATADDAERHRILVENPAALYGF